MQLGPSTQIPDGLLAAMLLNEKLHHGVTSSNPALYPGTDERNSTTALGLQAGLLLNRVSSRYTGKERDLESGLDYFGARYYASNMGRWMSPDWADKPEAVPYSSLDNPQSLNLYGYVLNNPLSHADSDGHCCEDELQFLGGVIQGAASSVSFGLVGAPRSSDSNASLAGQLLGTSIIGGTGTSMVSGSGPAALGGLALAPETGGASLVVSAGAVTASAVGSEMAAGASKNAVAVADAMGKGSYTNTHESGMTYDGKGGPDRAAKSGARVEKETGDKHVSTDHTPSSSDREGFKDESRRLDSHGGAGSDRNHNKIESPGKNYRKQDGSN